MTTRLYKVTVKGAEQPRLVEASNQAQAIRHVAAGLISAEVVNALEAAKLIASGVTAEIGKGE